MIQFLFTPKVILDQLIKLIDEQTEQNAKHRAKFPRLFSGKTYAVFFPMSREDMKTPRSEVIMHLKERNLSFNERHGCDVLFASLPHMLVTMYYMHLADVDVYFISVEVTIR